LRKKNNTIDRNGSKTKDVGQKNIKTKKQKKQKN
jgi:hypothetical protein